MDRSTKKPFFTIASGAGNLPKLRLVASDGARAGIYLYGAHVTSWVPAGGQERLFLSRKSQFRSGAPIRGGMPLVFPQFGASGPLPLHGLVRLMPWEFAGAEADGASATAAFRVRDAEESLRAWPYAFAAELDVRVGGRYLSVTLGVTNTGVEPFTFTTSLHTYLAIAGIRTATVEGLAGLRYRDAADGEVEKEQVAPIVDFPSEVNRIYFDAPAEVRLVEASRTTIVRKAGFSDVVVWNPAAEKCAGMSDLEPEDYLRFVCIEAATVGVPVRLAPGESWQGAHTLFEGS
jgi:glucose-6-phosphate 1-epimerase